MGKIATDYVYSPDDGGWYAQESDLDDGNTRVSRRIYSSEKALRDALHRGSHKWEAWS